MESVKQIFLGLVASVLAAAPVFADPRWVFPSIDGGNIDIAAHDGPALVVNTASLCAFTQQYEGLQALHETYGPEGLLVLAVPSDAFRQELGDEAKVQEFCEMTFGLDLPMTEITALSGPQAHPFYLWLAENDAAPRWNFHKVLVEDGRIVESWTATTRPTDAVLRARIESRLR